jgi:TPR repeat protein
MPLYFFDDDVQNNYELGSNYLSGCELKLNYEKAFYHLELAAKGGHSQAQVDLGLMYSEGTGISPDSQKALEWFQKASENGNASGTYNLSVLYRGEHGIEENFLLERLLLAQAAVGGLARKYDPPLRGMHIGLRREWYEKAAAQGFEAAQERLDALDEEERNF